MADIQGINVKIKRGNYRNHEIKNRILPLADIYKELPSGNQVSVYGDGKGGLRQAVCRIKLPNGRKDFDYVDDKGNVLSADVVEVASAGGSNGNGKVNEDERIRLANEQKIRQFLEEETDEEKLERMEETFGIVRELVRGTIAGNHRALVIKGPPGVGKSHLVHEELQSSDFASILTKDDSYSIIKGNVTAIGLYQKLFHFRSKGKVLVFDDCDTALWDETCLNLLKSALDTSKKRRLCWIAESRILEAADVPSEFEYEGSIIFLTNIDFANYGHGKLRDHLQAIVSRVQYVNLYMDTRRDLIVRMEQVIGQGMFDDYGFGKREINELMSYIRDNQDNLMELSLRMGLKLADLKFEHKDRWQVFARHSCWTREAQFKMRYEEARAKVQAKSKSKSKKRVAA